MLFSEISDHRALFMLHISREKYLSMGSKAGSSWTIPQSLHYGESKLCVNLN